MTIYLDKLEEMSVSEILDILPELIRLARIGEKVEHWYDEDHLDGISRTDVGYLIGKHKRPLSALPEPPK
jgi:hypothetical protein